jgi:glycosyltransferase involved in cell wall biosynthesis
MPLVSVVIPMRNAEPWIESTLRSVLSQEGIELEVVVVDDGSTDRSRAKVESIAFADARVRCVAGPQRGISASFNAGLSSATGEFLARCDADDLYPPGRLVRQLAWLTSRSDFVAVSGGYATITPGGRLVDEFIARDGRDDVTDELLHGKGRSHVCAYLFRTATLREMGGCREWFETSEDADLQFRLAERGRIGYEPVVSYLYRLHDASVTHRVRSARREFFERCAREFALQRRERREDELMRGSPPTPPPHGQTDAQSTRSQVQRMLLGRAWREHANGRKWEAVKLGVRAAAMAPGNLSAWRSAAALVVKRSGIGRAKA